jgi:hypothetical protein
LKSGYKAKQVINIVSVFIKDIQNIYGNSRIREGSVGIATGCGLDGQGLIRGMGKVFLLSTVLRPALGSIQPPIQWVPWAIPPG